MSNWQEIVVTLDSTIRKTVEVIDQGGLQIALVVNENQTLAGTVTDGDVRRGILSGIDLDESVASIMNSSPIKVNDQEEREKILFLMRTMSIQQIPLVNSQQKLVGLTTQKELLSKPGRRDNIVVLMAGGLGSRLGALTKECPKPLLKVGDAPILETILKSLLEKGFHRFYISVNYRADMVIEHFGHGSKWGCTIDYLHETTRLGTAGALSLLPEQPTLPMIVMNGDIMTRINYASLLDFHERNRATATMCIREFSHTIPYGVVKTHGNYVTSIKEKPVEKVFVSAGIYVLNPSTLNLIPEKQFYDMPSLFQEVMKQEEVVTGFPIHEYWLDIGREEDFNRAQAEFTQVFHA